MLRCENKKGFASVILILVVIIAVGGFILYTNRAKILQKVSNNSEDQNSNDSGLRIVGDKIYQGNDELFYNVKNVSEVRYGPGGNTIHFRSKDPNLNSTPCAKIDEIIGGLAPLNDQNPAPADKPWDYQRIGEQHTIPSCGMTGFLKKSNNFAYLTTYKKDVSLVVDNGATPIQIHLGPTLSKKIIHTQEETGTFSDGYVSITGLDGLIYMYPTSDTYVVNNKIAIAFGNMIIAVDLDTQTLIGYQSMAEKPYAEHLQYSFDLMSDKSVPFAVIDSAWEGPSVYLALIDFSGSKLKVTPLFNLDKSGWIQNDVRKLTWENGGMNLTLYAEKDVSKEVPDSIWNIAKAVYYDESAKRDTQFDIANQKATEFLQQRYPVVHCDLSPGLATGCFAALNITHYRYEPGGPLKKL